MYFCETRWIKDKCVAERLVKICPNITKLVDYYIGLPASKQPSCKSYMNIKNAVSDDLTIAKLHYYSYIARLLQPFLKLYQTVQPMLPFLFDDLKRSVKTLLLNIINPSVLEKSKTAKELPDIKLDDQKKLLKTKDVHIGFAATNEIQKQLQKDTDTVTIEQVWIFKRKAINFVIATIKKIYAKCPLLFHVVKNCTIFHPEKIQPDKATVTRKPD